MKNLAKDIATEGRVFDPPLVHKSGENYTVYDGNRRLSCIKLLNDPTLSPSSELLDFFKRQSKDWKKLDVILCQIEEDKEVIDRILYRRHTGSQNGIGQSDWDDRAKRNFIERTGIDQAVSVAELIEEKLLDAKLWNTGDRIPRSNLNRLLSSDEFRKRVGFIIEDNNIKFTHNKEISISAMYRIAKDLTDKEIVLSNIWDKKGKHAYLDQLDAEGVLPGDSDKNGQQTSDKQLRQSTATKSSKIIAKRPPRRTTLIKNLAYGINWAPATTRHHEIWKELQHHLKLDEHGNAIAALQRILIEISIDHYIKKQKTLGIGEKDKLISKCIAVASGMNSKSIIQQKYLNEISKLTNNNSMFSVETMNRWVHSSNYCPATQDLTAIWDTMTEFVVCCLNA